MNKHWINGPKELLLHAKGHMSGKKDFDKRIAFISIDNALEIIIRTYLCLPKRIIGSATPSRNEMLEAENSFPKLLDLLDKYASSRLQNVSLEDIEWYHRQRNQLYHNGNCLTIDIAYVEAYFEIAKNTYEKLFTESLGDEIIIDKHVSQLGVFVNEWSKLDSRFDLIKPDAIKRFEPIVRDFKRLSMEYDLLRHFRNEVVHGRKTPTQEEYALMLKRLFLFQAEIEIGIEDTVKVEIDQKKYNEIDGYDMLFPYVLRLVQLRQELSIATIQKAFNIGFARAGKISDEISRQGIFVNKKIDNEKLVETLKMFEK